MQKGILGLAVSNLKFHGVPTSFLSIGTENPFRRGELLNEELRRMKIAEKEKCEGNDNDVEVGEMVRSLDRVAFNIDHTIN